MSFRPAAREPGANAPEDAAPSRHERIGLVVDRRRPPATLGRHTPIQSRFDLFGHLVGREEKRLVQVDITPGDAAAGVPQQTRDGQLGKSEVTGDAGEGMPQNVGGKRARARLRRSFRYRCRAFGSLRPPLAIL